MLKKLLLALCITLPFAGMTQGKKKRKKAQESATAAPSQLPLQDYKQPGSPLPPLRLVSVDGTVHTNETLAGGGHLFLMFFNPTCEHCMDMTRALQKNIFLFNKSKVVLITGEQMKPSLAQFDKDLNMGQFSGTFPTTLDSSGVISSLFLNKSIPQVNVYDAQRKLIRTYSGISTIDSLKQHID